MVAFLSWTSSPVLSVGDSKTPPTLDTLHLHLSSCGDASSQCSQYLAAISHYFSLSPSHWNGENGIGYPAEDWRRVEMRKIRSRNHTIWEEPKFHLLIMCKTGRQWAHALASLFLSSHHAQTTLNLLKIYREQRPGPKRSRLRKMSVGVKAKQTNQERLLKEKSSLNNLHTSL